MQTVWWETAEDKILEPGETLIFWIKNGSNDGLTLSDFNSKFGVSLTEDQLIDISVGGMANSGKRGLCLTTNVGDMVDNVVYNDNNADNTTADKSITFQNQYVNDVFTTAMTSDEETLLLAQLQIKKSDVPGIDNSTGETTGSNNYTETTFNNETDSLAFQWKLFLKSLQLKRHIIYERQYQSDYKSYNLTRRRKGKIALKGY
ncbi:MAG: hypothetical protein ACLTCI_06755 [[Clostridium] nexile]